MSKLMTAKLFEAALGIAPPWTVASVDFDGSAKTLTVMIDFEAGSRFEVSGHAGAHPVHDTVTKNYRHLNFFEHECHLQVRTPRVKLPVGFDGLNRQMPNPRKMCSSRCLIAFSAYPADHCLSLFAWPCHARAKSSKVLSWATR